jgi:hypothetical protein
VLKGNSVKRFRIAALALVGAALIAGCGGSSTTEPTATGASIAAPTDGTLFTDPAGAYSITTGPDWTAGTGQTAIAATFWMLKGGDAEFSDNVNILTQAVPDGMDLDEYTKVSLENAPKLIQNLNVITNERITLASGQPASRLRFSGTTSGKTLEFLQVYAVAGKRAVVVTLTAPASRIDGDIAAAEPYMRTLKANS